MIERNKTLVREITEQIWNAGRLTGFRISIRSITSRTIGPMPNLGTVMKEFAE